MPRKGAEEGANLLSDASPRKDSSSQPLNPGPGLRVHLFPQNARADMIFEPK